MRKPVAARNKTNRAGQQASASIPFGEGHRYRVCAIHTQGDRVQWVITDSEQEDSIVAQAKTWNQLFANWEVE
jgi:hypothetical protein